MGMVSARFTKALKWLVPALVGLVGFAALGACSSDSGNAGSAGGASEAVVIDVRTPEEFASGHLDGALLIDIQAADFDERIGELDREASYVVYCRSGNRAGVAIERMAQLGIKKAVNAGSVEDAARYTGRRIVK
mgnify:CR=1 FL=1